MKLDRVIIRASDYRESFKFYNDVLGLRLKASWQGTHSWGAIFFCGDCLLEIIWVPAGSGNVECSYIPQHSKTELFFAVGDVDAEYKKLSSSVGVEMTSPEDMSWGYRLFTVSAPDKIKVVLAQPI